MNQENTIVQIPLFDWEQVKQELASLRQRVADLESSLQHELEQRRYEAEEREHSSCSPSLDILTDV